ncbi:hypothetical protein CBL_09564 [Carabus blaptoides fortunei]
MTRVSALRDNVPVPAAEENDERQPRPNKNVKIQGCDMIEALEAADQQPTPASRSCCCLCLPLRRRRQSPAAIPAQPPQAPLATVSGSTGPMVQMFYYENRGKCCKKLLRHNGYPSKLVIVQVGAVNEKGSSPFPL